jgi:hypothetical protein
MRLHSSESAAGGFSGGVAASGAGRSCADTSRLPGLLAEVPITKAGVAPTRVGVVEGVSPYVPWIR